QPHLVPTPARLPAGPGHSETTDQAGNLRRLVWELRRKNLTPLVMDITRADIGVPAGRAIVPGLRPWRARFAPGRLDDVPVALGRMAHPRGEGEMRPLPLFS